MKTLLVSLFLVFYLMHAIANPVSDAHAPDFIIKDTRGVEHQLYQYLSEGRSVILNFSSTWCKPCWNYKESGVLDKVYQSFGPQGTGEVVVLFLEADNNTSEDCLYGQEKCNDFTYGDWTSHSYPTSDLTGENRKIIDTYNVTRFPSIFAISAKDFSVKSMGQLSLGNWERWVYDQRNDKPEINVATLGQKKLTVSMMTYRPKTVLNIPPVATQEPGMPHFNGEEIRGPVHFQLYPNPCHENLFVHFDNSISQHIEVSAFNGAGKRVLRRKTKAKGNRVSVDIKSIQRGTYVFVVESGFQVWSKKIIVIY